MGKYFFLILFQLLFFSCGPKDFESHQRVRSESFLVSGDPMNLLKGSTLNRDKLLFSEELQELRFNSYMAFREKRPEEGSIPKSVSPNFIYHSRSQLSDYAKVTRKTSSGTKWVLGAVGEAFGAVEVVLRELAGNYIITGLILNGSGEIRPVEVLHLSRKVDGSAFSLLLKAQFEKEGNILFALNFSHEVNEASLSFQQKLLHEIYLFFSPDDERAMKWDREKELEISVCSANEQLYQKTVSAVQKWQEALGESLLLRAKLLASYPPFSDLNTHCIYQVDKFIQYVESDDRAIAGTATTFAHGLSGKIFDSDIFLWREELKKIIDQSDGVENSALYDFILIHELGHLLGLAHQWDTASVMSYVGLKNLTQYDQNAVQYLYGDIENDQE